RRHVFGLSNRDASARPRSEARDACLWPVTLSQRHGGATSVRRPIAASVSLGGSGSVGSVVTSQTNATLSVPADATPRPSLVHARITARGRLSAGAPPPGRAHTRS